MPAFVYLLQNGETGVVYVGKANDVEKRWRDHVNGASSGRPWPICRAIRKHGPEAFDLYVIEEWPTETEALAAEHELIVYLRSVGASRRRSTTPPTGARASSG